MAAVVSVTIMPIVTVIAVASLVVVVAAILEALWTAVRAVVAPTERAVMGESAETISVQDTLDAAVPILAD
jgi:hypothetical protein